MDDSTFPNEPAAEWVAVEALVPWIDNPRTNDRAVAAVAKSIRRFGFGTPLLARRANGEIIAGHTRLKAAIRLGLKQVPVRYLDLDPAEAHLLALGDNKLGELSGWDRDRLGGVLRQLQAEDQDLLDGTGFSEAEIAKLLADDEASAAKDESDRVTSRYEVLVTCDNERHQRDVLTQLDQLGLDCRALLT